MTGLVDRIAARLGMAQARWRRVFAGDDGQRVLAEIARFLEIDRPAYVKGDAEAVTARAIKRDLWRFIETNLQATPQELQAIAARLAKASEKEISG